MTEIIVARPERTHGVGNCGNPWCCIDPPVDLDPADWQHLRGGPAAPHVVSPRLGVDTCRELLRLLGGQLELDLTEAELQLVVGGVGTVGLLLAGQPVTIVARDGLVLLLAELAAGGWGDDPILLGLRVAAGLLGVPQTDDLFRAGFVALVDVVRRRQWFRRDGDPETVLADDVWRVRPEFRSQVAAERADSDVADALAALLALGQVTQ